MTGPYSHPDYFAFIDAIRQAPDDDLPRMIAADWLEEHGEERRASFIRCQIEKAKLERESRGKLPVREVECREITAHKTFRRFEFRAVTQNVERFEIGENVLLGVENIGSPHPFYGRNQFHSFCRIIEVNQNPHHACTHLIAEHGEVPEGYDRCRELARLEEELLPKVWLGEPKAIYFSRKEGFTRGFLESIRIRGADWTQHADEILKRNPVRKVVCIDSNEYGTPRLMSSTGLRYWKSSKNYPQDCCCDLWPGIEFEFEREPIRFQGMPVQDLISNAADAGTFIAALDS